MQSKPLIISLEGCIGVGKSTLGPLMKDAFTVSHPSIFYPEVFDVPLLNLYLSNMSTYADCFQLNSIIRRLDLLDICIANKDEGIHSIIDRSIYGDLCFVSMLSDQNLVSSRVASTIDDLVSSYRNEINFIIHLKTSASNCMSRLHTRGHSSELSAYTLQYFDNLIKAHDNILSSIKGSTVITVDASDSPSTICSNLVPFFFSYIKI